MTMHFSENYPYKPPKCKFPQGVESCHYSETILMGIHYLLDWPSPNYSAQIEGYNIYIQDNVEYKRRVRQQAEQYPALF
ncbi:hypothetical protein RDI58_017788 [Solanum bulbocastanum]|uniref:Uncharacterized protein n=1 Tax=Solanum bulbocastanum TaxID=147425 RepID=A0AAN8YCC2_SOLBU